MKCWLFNLGLWWMLLELADFLFCAGDEFEAWTFSGAFYDWHKDTCPEVR